MLRFTPTAWAKLLYLRDIKETEVGGFGITEADDLLFVTDVVLVKQMVTSVSVSFDDNSVADMFEDQVSLGRMPEQFARIWVHTHPGCSPEPSSTDEKTFARVFGSCDWAIMLIVSRDGKTFARLRFNVGPGGEVNIPVCIDYSIEFGPSDFNTWKKQYADNVTEEVFQLPVNGKRKKAKEVKEIDIFGGNEQFNDSFFDSDDMIDQLELMDPQDREMFMDDLAVRSEFWDESGVVYE